MEKKHRSLLRWGVMASLLTTWMGMTTSCTDNMGSVADSVDPTPTEDLVSPRLSAVVRSVTATDSLFSGFMVAYPCTGGTTNYFGNYNTSSVLTSIYAAYYLADGVVDTTKTNAPVYLPLGTYEMLYWGYPNIVQFADVEQPSLSIGSDLSTLAFTTYASELISTEYQPTAAMLFGSQTAVIGSDTLFAALEYATTMVNVVVQNTDSSVMTSIDSVWIEIDSIAQQVNVATAAAQGSAIEILFPLTINADSTAWSADSISFFPSVGASSLTLNVQLDNGTVKTYSQAITNPLTAGALTSLLIELDTTLSLEKSTGVFSIANVTEQQENITVTTW